MSKTFILVDTANTFFRARHVVRGSLEDKVGMSIILFLAVFVRRGRTLKATILSSV